MIEFVVAKHENVDPTHPFAVKFKTGLSIAWCSTIEVAERLAANLNELKDDEKKQWLTDCENAARRPHDPILLD